MRRQRHSLRSLMASVCAVLLFSGVLLSQGNTAGAATFPRAELDAIWLINQTRGEVGESSVGQDPWLTILARVHADRIAADNALYHQDLNVPLSWGWHWVGENVAYSSIGLVDAHEALKRSPGHLANMRQPYAVAAGTGMAFGAGRLYVVQLFAY